VLGSKAKKRKEEVESMACWSEDVGKGKGCSGENVGKRGVSHFHLHTATRGPPKHKDPTKPSSSS